MKNIIIALICIVQVTCLAMDDDSKAMKDLTQKKMEQKERKIIALERLAQVREREADAAELHAVSTALKYCKEREVTTIIIGGPRLCDTLVKRYNALVEKQSL